MGIHVISEPRSSCLAPGLVMLKVSARDKTAQQQLPDILPFQPCVSEWSLVIPGN